MITKLKCFGTSGNTGNIAYIIEGDSSSDVKRQELAKEENVAVCVFVDEIIEDTAKLSFFYTHKKSPLCLHGTLAFAKLFFDKNPNYNKCVIESSSGKKITATRGDNPYLELIPEFNHDGNKYRTDAKSLLNIADDCIVGDIVVSSIGSPKLLVQVKSKDILFFLYPDLTAINEWSKQTSINGIYAYYIDENKNAIVRNFNHILHGLEDVATGVGSVTLCYYLGRDVTVFQGENLGNQCMLNASFHSDKIILSGNVSYT